MPIWVLALFFLSGFLLVSGGALALPARENLVDLRMRGIGGRAFRARALVRAGWRETLRDCLLRITQVFRFKSPEPRFIRRIVMAGFPPATAGAIVAARILLAGSMFVLSGALSVFIEGIGVSLLFAPVWSVATGYLLPSLWLGRRIRSRQRGIRRTLPAFLDLLVVAVEAGMALGQAIHRVGQEAGSMNAAFGREIHILNMELQSGKPRTEALRNLYERTGVEELKTLTVMVTQADRYGVSISQTLRVFSDALRTMYRLATEEAAAKVPIKISFPLVFFIFPALMVMVLGPAAIKYLTEGLLK